ncbi:MAG: ubiquinone/menaquinone biosynthesis methyltransferase [Phycisphaerae bacterium]|nr:ubiquinone/menaquinone biosynthesis methyltransferase [Phycisphaerae bacterium]
MNWEPYSTSQKPTAIWSRADLVDPHASQDKGRRVREMFDGIADRYDLANAVISFGMAGRWRRVLAKTLHRVFPSAHRILDLACGTGDMMRELLDVFPQAHIQGVDFSEKMIEVGGKKLSDASFSFCCADAMALPMRAEYFDAVTCVFGLRNFQSLSQSFDEMFRVLKPGGYMAILEFQPPNNSLFGFLFNLYFERILPVVGAKIARAGSSGAYEYLPRSVKCWHDEKFVIELLQEQGMTLVEVRKMCMGGVWAIVAVK